MNYISRIGRCLWRASQDWHGLILGIKNYATYTLQRLQPRCTMHLGGFDLVVTERKCSYTKVIRERHP